MITGLLSTLGIINGMVVLMRELSKRYQNMSSGNPETLLLHLAQSLYDRQRSPRCCDSLE